MANFTAASAFLPTPVVTGRASQGFRVNLREKRIVFNSPDIGCEGASLTLNGSANEPVRGWELGFFQLQFIETNYATYRGRASLDGGAKVSWSHNTVCRDTDEQTPDLWYDPYAYRASTGHGVARPNNLDATGNLILETGFVDSPMQRIATIVENPDTGHMNFLHHADIAFHFCTMLVVKNPADHFTVLKHFYWNVRWEAHFHPDVNGIPQLTRHDHFDINVQQHVQNGTPNDPRFRSKILVRQPVANDMASREPTRRFARDWSIT